MPPLLSPDLLDFQRRAVARFLQLDRDPASREELGLEAAFRAAFPIEHPGGTAELHYMSYTLEAPRYDARESARRGYTWAAPIKIVLRLIHHDKAKQDGERTITDIKEQEVYFGEIPLMTERATFIVDGKEKVLLSRLERACGAAWMEEGRGLRLTSAAHDEIRVRLAGSGQLHVELALDPETPPAAALRDTSAPRTLHLTPAGPVLSLDDRLDAPPKARRDILDPQGNVLLSKGRDLGKAMLEVLRDAGCVGVPLSDRDVGALRAAEDLVTPRGKLSLAQHTPLSKAVLRHVEADGINRIPVRSRYDVPPIPPPATLDSPEDLGRWFEAHVARFQLTRAGRASIAATLGDGDGEEAAGGAGPLSAGELAGLARRLLAGGGPRAAARPRARLVAAGDLLSRHAWLGMQAQSADVRNRLALVKAGELPSIMPHDIVNAGPFMLALRCLLSSPLYARVLAPRNPLAVVEQARHVIVIDKDAPPALGYQAMQPWAEAIVELPVEARIDEEGIVAVEGPRATSVAAALLSLDDTASGGVSAAGVAALRRAIPPIAPEAPPGASDLWAAVARAADAAAIAPCDGEVVWADVGAVVIQPNHALRPVVVRLRDHDAGWDGAVRKERPSVERGARVRAGDVLAEGEGCAGGALALGRNVVAAYAPELAPETIIVSERAAREGYFDTREALALEQVARDTRNGREVISREVLDDGDRELARFNESGIVREGEAVAPGDVLVAMGSPARGAAVSYKDASLRAPAGMEGIVRRVDLMSRRGAADDLPALLAQVAARRAALTQEKQVVLDALAEAARKRGLGADDAELGELRERVEMEYQDETWQLDRGYDLMPGEIHRVRIVIERERALSLGDELRDGYGRGGRVVELRPEARMPRLADGTPVDVLLAAPTAQDGAAPAGVIYLMKLS